MSEFHDRYTVSRLVGAPPGYVGYDEGGQLTEKVRRKPFSVVLFDEVEKAHPDVFNTLLQVLEDGRLTDGQGRIVDFKNTVLILTTNLGTRDIAKAVSLGFQAGNDTASNYERMKNRVTDELKQHFRPEFLNRIDDIIVFHQLTQEEIVEIVDIMLTRVDGQLKNKDMGLELTPNAKALLAKKGWDPVLGARPLRRTIQREIEDSLSEKILFGELTAGQIVVVDTDRARATSAEFTFRGEPKPSPVPDDPAGRRCRRRSHRGVGARREGAGPTRVPPFRMAGSAGRPPAEQDGGGDVRGYQQAGTPGQRQPAVRADRGAEQQPAQRLGDRRDRLVRRHRPQPGLHRLHRSEGAGQVRQEQHEEVHPFDFRPAADPGRDRGAAPV